MNKFLHTILQLQPGDRIVVPKSALDMVQHHAIYLGRQDGQHWFIENKDGIGVRVVNERTFFNGVSKITRTEKFHPKPGYSRNDLVKYALSKRGRAYDLLNYNCEHFANEVQYFRVKSQQADTGKTLLTFGGLALLLLGAAAMSRK